jgi:hypothetical protein
MVFAPPKSHPRTWINWDGETDQWADLLGENVQNYRADHVASVDQLPKRQRDRLTGADVQERLGPGRRPGMAPHIAARLRSGGKT